MSGTGLPLNPPGNSPAVGDQFFENSWIAFFDNLTTVANGAAVANDGTLTGETSVNDLTVGGTLTVDGVVSFSENLTVAENLTVTGNSSFTGSLGFFGATPVAKQTVVGSKGGNSALTNLLIILSSPGYGLLNNDTT